MEKPSVVLIVEDEARLAADIVEAVGASGFVAETSADGEEAWFRGSTEPYVAIVLDIGLPKLDGLTILKRWRQEGIATPVIMLTARGSWSERVEGIDAGADLWLSNAAVLRAIVESWASDPQLRELWLAQMATFTDAAVTRIEAERQAKPAVAARLDGVDVGALAASLTWTGERLYYLAACGVPPFDDRRLLVDTMTHLWVSALYD